MTYVLLTKFWNEYERIPSLVDCITRQTQKPEAWLLLDDGSTDGSLRLFKRLAAEAGISVLSVRMPKKTVGNVDAVGRVYQKAFDRWKQFVTEEIRPSYLAMMDVDTKVSSDYFRILCRFLDEFDRVGSIAGQIRGSEKRNMPQGSGKVVRWQVVESLNRMWDLDADTLLNIKAIVLGYWNVIITNVFVDTPPTFFFTVKGSFKFGRRMYYVRRPFLIMVFTLLRGLFRRKRVFLERFRGWCLEAARMNWRCNDEDVLAYYGLRRYLSRKRKCVKMVKIIEWKARLVCKTVAES